IFYLLPFSLVYVAMVLRNLLLHTVTSEPHLHSPMYFRLGNFSFIDKSLASFALTCLQYHISCGFTLSITQIVFLRLLGGAEILLISMSDGHVTLRNPLHYFIIRRQTMCVGLVILSWIVHILHVLSQLTFTMNLPFQGPREINSFFCDLLLVIKFTCVDYNSGGVRVSTGGMIALVCFILL
uniref:G-protein coupled receptors family 1 profile domain-containing protein n=1 Tax=Otolemur garnettii TaxID=30611 RepID=H0XQN9_OTOGA